MKTVARVTEISAASDKGLEDAIKTGVDRANKTLKNVMGAWVEGIKVDCDSKGKIKTWRVNMKVTFVLAD
jgi:dodecin